VFFLLPNMIGFLVFICIPVISSLLLSFSKWDFVRGLESVSFVGLRNFLYLFRNQTFRETLSNTFVFTFVSVPLQLLLGLIIAEMIDKAAYLKKQIQAALFIPYISSVVASAVIWRVMFHPSYGPINLFLQRIGIENPPAWLGNGDWAMTVIIMMFIWMQIGYFVIVFTAGLGSIPTELYEAAEIDGAGPVSRFIRVTMPLISPITFFLGIIGLIGSFKAFDHIYVLTLGGPGNSTSVMSLFIYLEAFQFYRMGTASAAAWILFIAIFTVTVIQWRGEKKWVNYQ